VGMRSAGQTIALARLYTEPLVLIVASAHRLAQRKVVELVDLREETFVTFRSGATVRKMLRLATRRAGFASMGLPPHGNGPYRSRPVGSPRARADVSALRSSITRLAEDGAGGDPRLEHRSLRGASPQVPLRGSPPGAGTAPDPRPGPTPSDRMTQSELPPGRGSWAGGTSNVADEVLPAADSLAQVLTDAGIWAGTDSRARSCRPPRTGRSRRCRRRCPSR
jgi:hypothetical protein